MKSFVGVLIYAVVPLLIVCILIASIAIASGDSGWYRAEYEKLDLSGETGMSIDDMHSSIMLMVDYMKGADSMDIRVKINGVETDMFNQTEIAHMDDVQKLYGAVRTAGIILLALILAVFAAAFIIFKNEALVRLSKAYLICLAAFAVLVAALVIWLAVDFDSFWRLFHIIFLDLESSTFDPRVSRMIQICPAKLFEDMIIYIISLACAALISLGAGSAACLIISKKRKKTQNGI